VRSIVRDLPILIPGVGAQGGSLESAVIAGKNERGDGIMINASRSILYASSGKDFAEAAAAEASEMNATIQSFRR
jgi:orotidine-5'-phosphate decarboxylase